MSCDGACGCQACAAGTIVVADPPPLFGPVVGQGAFGPVDPGVRQADDIVSALWGAVRPIVPYGDAFDLLHQGRRALMYGPETPKGGKGGGGAKAAAGGPMVRELQTTVRAARRGDAAATAELTALKVAAATDGDARRRWHVAVHVMADDKDRVDRLYRAAGGVTVVAGCEHPPGMAVVGFDMRNVFEGRPMDRPRDAQPPPAGAKSPCSPWSQETRMAKAGWKVQQSSGFWRECPPVKPPAPVAGPKPPAGPGKPPAPGKPPGGVAPPKPPPPPGYPTPAGFAKCGPWRQDRGNVRTGATAQTVGKWWRECQPAKPPGKPPAAPAEAELDFCAMDLAPAAPALPLEVLLTWLACPGRTETEYTWLLLAIAEGRPDDAVALVQAWQGLDASAPAPEAW